MHEVKERLLADYIARLETLADAVEADDPSYAGELRDWALEVESPASGPARSPLALDDKQEAG